MTVQEFLRRIPFNDVVEALRNSRLYKGNRLCVSAYKEAFDILCNIPPKDNSGKVKFYVSYYETGEQELYSDGLEDYCMEDIVGKEIIMPKDNPFTDVEFALEIIYWATYYGYTPRARRDRLDINNHRMCTKYSIRAHQLHVIRDLIYPYPLKSVIKRVRRAMRSLNQTLNYRRKDERDWYLYMVKRDMKGRRLNRAKRKRAYRIEKRIERLKELDRRQFLIENITGIAEKKLPLSLLSDTIMSANAIIERWRESHTFGKSSRIDYIIDLISNYSPRLDVFHKNGFNMCFVIAYTAPEKTLSLQEKATLAAFLAESFRSKGIGIVSFSGEDALLGEELALRFIGIRWFANNE